MAEARDYRFDRLAGRRRRVAYVLEWEQGHLDAAVVDLFGFHALQLGLPELDALRANRMPHRWVAVETAAPPSGATPVDAAKVPRAAVALHCDFDACRSTASSLDLVVLPHALELARDPHLALREVERVLVPEGRVVIIGFNPASLWGLRQRLGRLRRGLGLGEKRDLFLPREGEFIALPAPARLAAPAQLRGRGRALRLLPAAAALADLAGALRVDGTRRRALVAGVRRGLLRWSPSSACAACAWSAWCASSAPRQRIAGAGARSIANASRHRT